MAVTSSNAAVEPAIRMRVSGEADCIAWGTADSRSRLTSWRVSASCGAVVGITVISAVSPFAVGSGGKTAATPSSAISASRSCSSSDGVSRCVGLSTSANSLPLTPGPKPSAIRS